MARVSPRSVNLSSTGFSLNSCSHSRMSEHNGLPVLSGFHLYLVLGFFVVDEVDELEEYVGCLLSCFEGVIEVEGLELEEEFDDKPGTTIGTKFSELLCIRIPFFERCGF